MAGQASAPLTGYRILVTRARAQAGALTQRLETLGATVVELPAIEIVPTDPAPLDAAIRRLPRYDWVVFTSANAVGALMDRIDALGLNASALSGVQVAAIGKATAVQLLEKGIQVDLVPPRFVAESVVSELAALGVVGKRILLPQAEIARDVVATGLRDAGAEVDVVVAYRTARPDGHDAEDVRGLVANVDVMTFASPSSVRNVIALAGGALPGAPIVCIGPVTADAARDAGLTVAAIADEHTLDGLVDAVVRLIGREVEGDPDDEHQ